MAENMFQKWVRAAPVLKTQGWAGFFKYLKTSKPASTSPAVGPTAADVLAADQRTRKALGQGSQTRVTGGLAGQPARLTLPTLIGV